MGAMQQIRTPRGPIVALPASKEVLLEIQVNNLINKVLFSGAAEDCKSLAIPESHGPPSKENALRPVASDTSSDSNVAADVGDNVASQKCTRADSNSGERPSNGSLEVEASVKGCQGYRVSSPTKQAASEDLSASSCSLEGGASTKHDVGTQLIRTETFPCKWEMQSRPCDMRSEMKHSCRKPPRPPRPPRSLSGDGSRPKLARCVSDASIFLQAARRTRMERRRKMAAAASPSPSASLWALLFTVCFAVVMLAPGLWSESTEEVALETTNAPSPPLNYHMRLSVVAGSLMEANVMVARSKDSLQHPGPEHILSLGHNKVGGHLPSLFKNKPGGEFASIMPSEGKLPEALKPLVSRGAMRKLRGHLMTSQIDKVRLTLNRQL